MADTVTIEIKGEYPISHSCITAAKILATKPYINICTATDGSPSAFLYTGKGDKICFLVHESSGRLNYITECHGIKRCSPYWLNRDLSDDAWDLIIQLSKKAYDEMLRQKAGNTPSPTPFNVETVVSQMEVRGGSNKIKERAIKTQSLLY